VEIVFAVSVHVSVFVSELMKIKNYVYAHPIHTTNKYYNSNCYSCTISTLSTAAAASKTSNGKQQHFSNASLLPKTVENERLTKTN